MNKRSLWPVVGITVQKLPLERFTDAKIMWLELGTNRINGKIVF